MVGLAPNPEASRIRDRLVGVGRVVVGVAITGLVLGLLGRLWWVFDLMANYRPQFGALLVVIGALIWALDRDAALASLFVGLVGLSSLLPLYLGSHPVPAEGVETIEIVSFNVGISNQNRSEVAAYLADEDPDLVFLFESSFEWEEAIRLAELPLRIVTVVPRSRVVGVTVLASNELSPTALEADIGHEAAAVSVVLDGERIDVLGVHPPSPTTQTRAGQRDRLLRATGDWAASRSVPVVVLGDFNATSWSAAYRSLRWRVGLVDTLHGNGIQPSWPVGWGILSIPIDHVLHTRDLGSTARRTGPSFGSAHRAVVVSVGLAG